MKAIPYWIVLVFLLFPICAIQADTIPFKAGLYLSHENLRKNIPDYPMDMVDMRLNSGSTLRVGLPGGKVVTNSQTINTLDIKHLKVTDTKSSGKKKVVRKEDVWAIVYNRQLYVNLEGYFVLAPVVGALCHLTVEKNRAEGKDYEMGPLPQKTTLDKVKYQSVQWVLELKTGHFYPFKSEHLAQLIADDKPLLTHFENNEKRDEQLFLYLQEYNKRHLLMRR